MKIFSLNYFVWLGVLLVGCYSIFLSAQTSLAGRPEKKNEVPKVDLEAIQQTALDYIEGWYEGNTLRMNRSLHPDLIKRTIEAERLQAMSKRDLVTFTGHARIAGKKWDVKIMDVYKNIAKLKSIPPIIRITFKWAKFKENG